MGVGCPCAQLVSQTRGFLSVLRSDVRRWWGEPAPHPRDNYARSGPLDLAASLLYFRAVALLVPLLLVAISVLLMAGSHIMRQRRQVAAAKAAATAPAPKILIHSINE